MEQFTEQLKKGKNIRMTDAESARIKEALTAHMQVVSFPTNAAVAPQRILSPYTTKLSGMAVFMRVMASALVLVTLIGSGAAFASADATPGTFLYPIRIHVKEAAERALLRAPEKKLAYDQARLETRITELETLADTTAAEDPETVFVAKAAFTENLGDLEQALVETENSGRVAVTTETRQAIAARLSAYAPEHEATPMMATMATVSLSAKETANAKVRVTNEDSTDKKEKLKESIRELLKVSRARILEKEQAPDVTTDTETKIQPVDAQETISLNENANAEIKSGETTSTEVAPKKDVGETDQNSNTSQIEVQQKTDLRTLR
jgi:hypothetical protein